jgi:integrase
LPVSANFQRFHLDGLAQKTRRSRPGRAGGGGRRQVRAASVKRCVGAAGLDASKYSGHSLRSGFATAAAIAGASERAIMNQTGHQSSKMVRRYIRDGNLFRDNAAAKLGL